MTKRDVKFIMRIVIMVMMALVAGLGVRVVLESVELLKIAPRTPLRDMLIFVSPIASLAILHYTLALRSFGIRSLQTEGLTFIAVVCVFLAITLPYYFGSPASKCAFWKILGCNDRVAKLNYWLLSVIGLVGLVALFLTLRREKARDNPK